MVTNSEDRKFVETLKTGDKIFILTVGGFYRDGDLLLKEVKRVTKPHIIIDIKGNEQKFRKDNLEEADRNYGRMYMGDSHDEIVEYKEPHISKYKRQLKETRCAKIIKWLGEKKLKDLPGETLDAYYTTLSQFEKKEGDP